MRQISYFFFSFNVMLLEKVVGFIFQDEYFGVVDNFIILDLFIKYFRFLERVVCDNYKEVCVKIYVDIIQSYCIFYMF